MKYACSVIAGHGRGKQLGFPTLNLVIPESFQLKTGIYACKTWINKKQYLGALHFGPAPVFNQSQLSLEIYLIDHQLSHPPNRVSFSIIKYLRPVKNFSTPEQLSHQISQDVSQIKSLS